MRCKCDCSLLGAVGQKGIDRQAPVFRVLVHFLTKGRKYLFAARAFVQHLQTAVHLGVQTDRFPEDDQIGTFDKHQYANENCAVDNEFDV